MLQSMGIISRRAGPLAAALPGVAMLGPIAWASTPWGAPTSAQRGALERRLDQPTVVYPPRTRWLVEEGASMPVQQVRWIGELVERGALLPAHMDPLHTSQPSRETIHPT